MAKKILITGASSGIGLAITQLSLSQGWEVSGVARNFSQDDCSNLTPGLTEIQVDLANIDDLPAVIKETTELNQGFDVLVLNAGVGRFGGLEQFSHQQIQQVINTNLVSNLFLLKHYLPQFKIDGGKDIVLIGSESSLQGAKQGSVYCASKFAVRGLAQSLRADCANNDIRVMLINPGPVDTDFFDDLNFAPQEGEDFNLQAETVAQAALDALALPRNAVSEEINIQPIKRSFQKK